MQHVVGKKLRFFVALTLFVGLIVPAQAVVGPTVYNLSNDWSNLQNPNGAWEYGDSVGALPTNHPSYSILGVPGWAFAANGQGANASWFKTIAPNLAPNQTTFLSFVPGDVISAPWDSGSFSQPGRGPSSVVRWTSPSAGTVDVTGFTWHAHLTAQNSVLWDLSVNNVTKASGSLDGQANSNRANTTPFSVLGESVSFGDVVSFSFTYVNAANWAGLDMTVALNPVPEPETYAMMLAGLGLIGAIARRRRVK